MSKQHFKKASKSPYLGSWDLDEMKPVQLTISGTYFGMSSGLKENSKFNFVKFKEKGYKDMIINTTNGLVLRALSGSPYIDDWVGLRIEIKVKEVKAFGAIHDALRISPKKIKLTKKLITSKDDVNYKAIKQKYDEGADIKIIQEHYDIDESLLKD